MQHNYSIGTDIVEVNRLRKMSENHEDRFFKHVFTENEVEWCQTHINPYVHLAGKFAAKEAVKKALMALGESNTIPMNVIEIHRDKNQPPTVRILQSLSRSYRFQISISHTEHLATAVAIAELT